MIHKQFVTVNDKTVARVTFSLPASTWADSVHLVGDFNQWDRNAHPFAQQLDGAWSITVELELGHAYQFRYLINQRDWSNDQQADAHVYNIYGSDNFVIVTDLNFKPHQDERGQTG